MTGVDASEVGWSEGDGAVGLSTRRLERLRRREVVRAWSQLGSPAGRRCVADAAGPGGVSPSRGVSTVGRVSKCGVVPVGGGGVVVTVGANGAYFGGLQHCGSVWACPVCSARIRQHRGSELERGVAHFRAGHPAGEVVLVTLTLRHGRDDDLVVTLDAAFAGWSRGVIMGKGWSRAKQRFGVLGWARTVEATLGGAGWHPHCHAVLFLAERLSDDSLEELRADVFGRWSGSLVRFGLAPPSAARGVRVDRTDPAATGVGAYLQKPVTPEVASSRRVSIELARADLKASWSGLTPFELLDLAGTAREGWARHRWAEYEQATWGRHCLTWSRGCRALLGLGARELSDEELVYDPDPEPTPLAVLDGSQWRVLRRHRGGSASQRLLGLVEAGEDRQARWWLEGVVGPVVAAGWGSGPPDPPPGEIAVR